ncbi:MAG: class I SAM-dependent methyltransferase, partial [Acidobacteria bacterium]|nr:class I SAM-dependent methyltransferase [Acidobacteriota bacterium]
MPGVDESAIAHGMRPEDGECPACGSSAPPEHLYRKWGYPIRRCLCGLGSTGLDANFDPGLLYSKDYFNGSRKDGYADYIGSRSILQREFQQTLRVLAEFGVTGGKLLEIGCAFGIFLETARQRFEVSGIEVCPEAAVHCRQRGLKVQTGAATGERIARDGPFDVIVMLDVIEHLPDPLDVVRAVGTELRPGGHLLITTGDWGSLVSRLMGSSWRLMTPPQHVYFFTRQTLA